MDCHLKDGEWGILGWYDKANISYRGLCFLPQGIIYQVLLQGELLGYLGYLLMFLAIAVV